MTSDSLLRRFRSTLPKRRSLLAAGIAFVLLVGFAALPAFAVHDTGAFELDHNAVSQATAGEDWDLICKAHPSTCTFASGFTPPAGTTTASSSTFETDQPGQSIFTGAQSGGSSKDPQLISGWRWKSGSVPDKDELMHGYAARYTLAASSACPNGPGPTFTGDCKLLYFGADRFDASGDAQIGFWFYQNPVACIPPAGSTDCSSSDSTAHKFAGEHKDGDILVLSDFTGGGEHPNIKVYEWNFDPTPGTNPADDGALPGGGSGSCSNHVCDDLISIGPTGTNFDCASAAAGDAACATVNDSSTETAPWVFQDKSGNSSFAASEFYEGGINLSLLPAGIASECFSSFSVETRSSATPDAVLKDFVLGAFAQCSASMTTQVSSTSVNPSTPVHDTATVVGNQSSLTPTGTVTFFLCSFAAGTTDLCDDTDAAHHGTQLTNVPPQGNLSGSGGTATADSPNVNTAANPLSPGRYCFRAEWPGDSNYTTAIKEFGQSTNSVECFTVVQSPTTTVTEPRLASNGNAITSPVAVNTHVVDHALITGATGFGSPTGTVNFFICNPGQVTGTAGNEVCSGGTALAGNPVTATPVANSSPPQTEATSSPDVVANAVGVWCFRAVYTPDTTNYTGSDDSTHDECFTVRDTSSLASQQNWLPNDHFTITSTGGTVLKGTIVVTLRSGTCTGTTVYTEPTFTSPAGGWASGTSFDTTNGTVAATTFKVTDPNEGTYFWRIVFTSSDPLVDGFTKCETSTVTIDNNP